MKKRDHITEEQKKIAHYARALGHPVRVHILELLSRQTCCYSGDLADELPIARSTLSQHLKALKDAGLIQGKISPPKIKYCLDARKWKEAKELLGSLFAEKMEIKINA